MEKERTVDKIFPCPDPKKLDIPRLLGLVIGAHPLNGGRMRCSLVFGFLVLGPSRADLPINHNRHNAQGYTYT